MVAGKDSEGIRTNVQQGVKTLTREVNKRFSDLRRQVENIRANSSPNDRQMLRLGVAFVIGLAVGIALSRTGESS